MYCNIIVTRPFNHVFTYDVGSAKVKKGQIVLVPFGKSKVTGVVWDEFEKNKNKNYAIKQIIKKFEIPSLNKNTMKFQCFQQNS